jgi:sec-independent protein translocase protein TatA
LASPTHIALVLVIVALVFGAKKLPELGHGLGQGMRNFKRGISGEDEAETPPAPTQLASTIETPPAEQHATPTNQTTRP